MDMSRILIAKTGKTASEWLPLAVHLEDTTGIMQCMIRDMIPPSFPESCALSPEAFEKTGSLRNVGVVKSICKQVQTAAYQCSNHGISATGGFISHGYSFFRNRVSFVN